DKVNVILDLVLLCRGQRSPCLCGNRVGDDTGFVVAEHYVPEAEVRERCSLRVKELELVPHVVWGGEFAAEDVEVEFLPVVTATQSDVEALKPLLAVQDKAFLPVVVGHLEGA